MWSGPLGTWISILLSFLPLLIFLALLFLTVRRAQGWPRQERPPDRYDLLRKIGELRDTGVLTEEEFQQEKRRILDAR